MTITLFYLPKYPGGDLIFKIQTFSAILHAEWDPTCPLLLFQKGRDLQVQYHSWPSYTFSILGHLQWQYTPIFRQLAHTLWFFGWGRCFEMNVIISDHSCPSMMSYAKRFDDTFITKEWQYLWGPPSQTNKSLHWLCILKIRTRNFLFQGLVKTEKSSFNFSI